MRALSVCTLLEEGKFTEITRYWPWLTIFSDGNIRYFELENDKFEYLAEYKSADPQRGIAFMPKRGVNTHDNEVARAFKTVNDSYIEPISFIVPRRAETFQDDIYPPTTGLKPAMGPSEWLAGKEAIPPKISMANLYEGEGLKEVTGVQDAPTSTMGASEPEAAPAPKAAEPSPVKKAPEPAPEPTPVAKPAPSMKEQGASMAAMVSKFADDEEAETVEEDSSFEEVQKPVERPARSPEASSPSIKTSPWHQKEEEVKTQAASPAKVSNPTSSNNTPSRTNNPSVFPRHHPCCRTIRHLHRRCCRSRRCSARDRSNQGPDRRTDEDDRLPSAADAEPDCRDRVPQG